MTTLMMESAIRERRAATLVSRVVTLARACIPLTKLEEKEKLLEVYHLGDRRKRPL